jgi:fatty-acyl-CoA synthase
MTASSPDLPRNGKGLVARAWMRAIEMTAVIARRPHRILPTVIDEGATAHGASPALLSDRQCLTYSELAAQSNRYSRWALGQELGKGDTVALLMPNRPEYLAIWLGITKVGGVVALLNTNLTGSALAHCINIAAPKHLIVAWELVEGLTAALPELTRVPKLWIDGADHDVYARLDTEISRHSGATLSAAESRPVTIEDKALYIYTSGTTGLPKAASVTHGRVMQWSHWFAGMMETEPGDRLYNCLPMYHSVGGVQAPGSVLVSGGSVVLQKRFSARRFWADIVRWDCTLFQYIGELCRYLIHTEVSPYDTTHRIRMACGNGLGPDVWDQFKTRFQIPRIFEFYASTEGNVSLFNIEGERGAIGRVPPYLAHRFPLALVRFDSQRGEPIRDENGFCIHCAPNEVGEALGPILQDRSNIGRRFEGYTKEEESEKKILRNVFKAGDAWFRTGDLMRKDDRGFIYFVDRMGDTFRWKGENVATTEVSAAFSTFPGVKEAIVYGVPIPGTDGRAGMATLVAGGDLDLIALRAHLRSRLPSYACPLFIRLRNRVEVTGTFKYAKTELLRDGYNPLATEDIIYFNDPLREAFIRLDQDVYECIQAGQFGRRHDRGGAEVIPESPKTEAAQEKITEVDGV